jgi:hypothetical protein
MMLNSLKAASQLHLRPVPDSIDGKRIIGIVPQNFYNNHTGFFCKKEVQLQKVVKMPVFFRLGTKEYVDRMERKNVIIR